MMQINVAIDISDFRAALQDKALIHRPLTNFLTRAALSVESKAKWLAPVDTGRLRSSISTQITDDSARVSPRVVYGLFVETGTRPHWAPRGALQPWARRHGFPSGPRGDFLARRAIALRGTRAQPYMAPAAQALVPLMPDLLRRLKEEIEAIWRQHGR